MNPLREVARLQRSEILPPASGGFQGDGLALDRRADVQRLPQKLAWPLGVRVISSDAVPLHLLVEALVVG
jgi:hypothetical protein